ncbi:MAG: hypothetical protein ACOYOL_09280, partial [Chthoniobacterales bacterium]
MRVTLNLPEATPEMLDLAVSYFDSESRADFLRGTIMEMLEVVKEDAIPGPDGECVGSASTNERELFPERKLVWQSDIELEELRAEVARLRI